MCQVINQELVTKIEERIQQSFPGAPFEVSDGEDGMHLQVKVTSNEFKNKAYVEQHKMVLRSLKDLLDSGELHSINIKTVVA